MDLSSTFASIGEGVINARIRAGVESVIGNDGRSYCKKCNEPLSLILHFDGEFAKILGSNHEVPRNCDCMRKMFEAEDRAANEAKQAELRAEARRTSLGESRFVKMTFDSDDGRMPKIRKMCQRYAEQYEQMLAGNYGLAFVGANGTGKTFWAACIANALIDMGISVWLTSLKALIAEMNTDYGEDREYVLRKIRRVSFLILDDYGAERGTDFSLEQAYSVIDTRYNAEKPLIITANLTEETLRNPPNMALGRAYSRIVEMCPAIIRIEGERRNEIAANKRNNLARLLKGD